MATAKGHMHQTQNNLKSTKKQELKTPEEELMKPLAQRTSTVFAKIIDHKRTIATDLTGKFPVTPNRGNKYLFVLYDYDSNCILIRPMNSRADSEFIRVFTDLHENLLIRGLNPAYTRLDNEASTAFQRELKANNIDFQLPPPVMHLRNAAEQAISIFKDHFIADIFSADPDFPMQNWDCLVEQAEITLNLLRPSRLNPKILSYAHLNGTFEYNRTTIPPPGTRNLVRDKPHNRGIWAPHGQEFWCVWTSMLHYRFLTSSIPKTASECVSDTNELYPYQKNFPSLSPADAVTSAAADLTEALQNPTPSIPIPHLGEKQTTTLRKLAAILNTAVPQAPAPTPAQLPGVETPKPPQPRTRQPAMTVPLEPATRQSVKVKY